MGEQRAGHTPLPWRFELHAWDSQWLGNIIGSYGPNKLGYECIRTISCQTKYEGHRGEALANAEFIVRAVNSHYEILGLLREWLGDRDMSSVHPDSLTGRTFAALKLSEASDD